MSSILKKIKDLAMTSRVKKGLNIFYISSVCAAIGTLGGTYKATSTYAKDQVITPIVDARIDAKTKFMCDKIDVLYRYNMSMAKKDTVTSDVWNDCVDEV